MKMFAAMFACRCVDTRAERIDSRLSLNGWNGRSKWRVVAFENDHCEKTDGFGWMDDGRDDAVVRSNLATDE